MRAVLALLFALSFAVPASAQAQHDYAYWADARDIPFAALESGAGIPAWVADFEAYIEGATPAISACAVTNATPIAPASTVTRGCAFPSGPTLNVTVRTPATIAPGRPVIYVLSAWGNVQNETVGIQAKADGYVVVELTYQYWYEALAPLYGAGGYLPVWGRIASRVAEQVEPLLPAHSGYAVISTATGSLIAPYFVMWRSQPRAVVTNGVLLSLDWLRRNYRVGPNFWDLGYVNSYAPVFLTMAPAPVQWQMGTSDAFWPSTAPLEGHTLRGQSTDEAYGLFATLDRGWGLLGGETEIHFGANGHLAPDYAAAMAFVEAN